MQTSILKDNPDQVSGIVVQGMDLFYNKDISFFYRLLYERYTDLIKRSLSRENLDDILRPGFGFVLFVLFEYGAMRPSDICSRTGLKASTLTVIVDQMVKKDLVDRKHEMSDRRAIQIRLLPKAEKLHDICYKIQKQNSAIICRGITDKNLEISKRVMKQMIQNMAKE